MSDISLARTLVARAESAQADWWVVSKWYYQLVYYDRRDVADLYLEAGSIYLKGQKFDLAFHCFDQAKTWLEQQTDRVNSAEDLRLSYKHLIGLVLILTPLDLTLCAHLHTSYINLLLDAKFVSKAFDVAHRMALTYVQNLKYDQALQWYAKALAINPIGTISIHQDITMLYLRLNNLNQVIYHLGQCRKLCKSEYLQDNFVSYMVWVEWIVMRNISAYGLNDVKSKDNQLYLLSNKLFLSLTNQDINYFTVVLKHYDTTNKLSLLELEILLLLKRKKFN